MKVGFTFLMRLEGRMEYHQANFERWIGTIFCSITTVFKLENIESRTP